MTYDPSYLLLSGFVALIAWGIAVRLVPVLWHLFNAFVLGFVAACLLGLWLTLTTSRRIKTHSYSLPEHAPAFVLPRAWPIERARYVTNLEYIPPALHPTSTNVSKGIVEFLHLALSNFVSSWYKAISPSSTFVNEVEKNICIALMEITDKVLQQDMVNLIVSRIVPIITTHLRDFENAERVVRSRAVNRNLPESEELDLAIAAKYRDGNLHPAASLALSDTLSLQQDYLRKLLIRILPLLLEEEMIRSRAVLTLIREIVSCAVLLPVFQMLIDPDTWNQLVEAYGKTTLQDRKTVKKMRAALDEHTSPSAKRPPTIELPRLQAHDSERAFERYVRAIRKTKTLSDARRFRNQIASQLARERLVQEQDPVFLRRLEMGKRVLDQKIAKMTHAENASAEIMYLNKSDENGIGSHNWSLTEIMHTTSGLSNFMEYMDRQNKMSLVQFWIVVDGFRNPLEDDFGEDERTAAMITWTDTDRLDVAQIAENYIMKRELDLPREFQLSVQQFLVAGRQATPEEYRAARMAILSSQSVVLEEMEQKHLPNFQKSDLYYKFLASDEGRTLRKLANPASSDNAVLKAGPVLSRIHTPPATRSSSQGPMGRTRDLRRAALSSSDIKGLGTARASDDLIFGRKSMDDSRPLFDDDIDSDHLGLSVQSLGNDSFNGDMQAESEVIENMEAALTKIMTQSPQNGMSDVETEPLLTSTASDKSQGRWSNSTRPSSELTQDDSSTSEKLKPSLATLGLVNTASRIGVFQDNDLFGDEEKFAEDEYADRDDDTTKRDKDEEIHQAAPGDLGLAEAITSLSDDIERLVSQEGVVDTLTRKAELTNNVAELRILGKSKSSLQREIRRKELQRQQYIVQESDNSLYGRASIDIESVMVGREDDGQEYAVYVIKVRRQAGDQMPAASWAIAHRYSEFHELHSRLRRRYPSTRNLEFPRRRMVMKLQKQFLHNRRMSLEAYLRRLLQMPDVCRSRELRSFLSQQAITQPNRADPNSNGVNTQDMISRIYNSVTDGMDEFLGNMAVRDQLSIAGQNLISAATTQISALPGSTSREPSRGVDDVVIEPGSVAEAEAELRAFEDKELAPFVKPICDIFLETFELNRGNNWLRGRAVVVVIHQLLGGTVERKVRDNFNALFTENALLRYLETAKNTIFPIKQTTDLESANDQTSGEQRQLRSPAIPRTKIQRDNSRHEASVVLATLIPDLVGSVVGRSNAQSAARRISAVMNNRRLNEHLAFTILDELVEGIFGEGPAKAKRRKVK